MAIKINQADVSHTAIIATIGKKSFRNAFEHLFKSKEELFEYLEHTYDPLKLSKSLRKENNIYLLAFADERPVGFAKVKKHSLNDQIESGAQMELQKIYVLPEWHGHGIGTSLLKEVRNIAREIYPDYLWLDTHVSNESAIRLYETNGYKKMGTYSFTIGTQTFDYYLMGLPVAFKVTTAC
ncbi:GNAT family N-acetyltransferase [Terrimonas pollutisoli]|uniref:GNAT family N-acetyltransferase n=1 Tax=Terrimonas pollutisoli TaxID=3034147 RepID=UPI0023EA99ED|nr:GNAT family N-acetyltransferase [Terrimonas sp. H1YJ31]